MANSYPVARIYKDGVFECIKAVEKGMTSGWSGTYTSTEITFNNGYKLRPATGLFVSGMSVSFQSGVDTIVKVLLSVNGIATGSTPEGSTKNLQVTIITLSNLTTVPTLTLVSPSGSSVTYNKIGGASSAQFSGSYTFPTEVKDEIGSGTPSISRQGTATFSKIVENQELLPTTMTGDEVNQYFSIGTWDNTKYSMVAVEKGTTNILDWWTEFVSENSSIFFVDFGQYQDTSKYPSLVYYEPSNSTTSNKLSYSGSLPITVTDLYFRLSLASTADKSNIDILFGLGDINNPNFRFRSSIGSGSSFFFTGGNSTYGYKSVPQVSISKDGVLTCAKLVEGDYDTEPKFIGTYSGNKLTFNNGYTVEVVSSYGGSTAIGSFNTGQIALSGYTSEQPDSSTAGSINLVLNEGNISVASYNPNLGTWNDDKTFYVYSIAIQSYTGWVTGNVEYLKITNTLTNTSVYYHNTSSIKNNFYEEESGDDTWVLKSTDRYQNYLTEGQ